MGIRVVDGADSTIVNTSRPGLTPGTSGFRRAQAGLFMTGLATFALLYVVQPLLPLLGREFAQNPTTASLALSVTTLMLALSVLPMAWASERVGRARVLNICLLTAAILGLCPAFAPSWTILLIIRGLQGVALAGIPAAALAWISEEIHPRHISFASGLYIAGTTVGGMTGRLVSGGLATWWGWQGAVLGVAVLSIGCAVAAKVLLPSASRRTVNAAVTINRSTGRRNIARVRLYLVGGLAMAAFVGVYNVLSYRLEASPYLLSPGAASLVFLAYLTGTVSSARAGKLVGRIGARRAMAGGLLVAVLGIAITLAQPVALVVVGVCLLTAGFFVAHSIASGLAPAGAAKPSLAAGRYVLFYYVGSSIGGPVLGAAYAVGQWKATAAVAAALMILAAIAAPPAPSTPPNSSGRSRRSDSIT